MAVALVARHLHTPIPDILEMYWDQFNAFERALGVIIRMETPPK